MAEWLALPEAMLGARVRFQTKLFHFSQELSVTNNTSLVILN